MSTFMLIVLLIVIKIAELIGLFLAVTLPVWLYCKLTHKQPKWYYYLVSLIFLTMIFHGML